QCFPLKVTVCQKYRIPYAYTTLPNKFGQTDQSEINQQLMDYEPIISRQNATQLDIQYRRVGLYVVYTGVHKNQFLNRYDEKRLTTVHKRKGCITCLTVCIPNCKSQTYRDSAEM
ncbi:unnamed protein product, partial [Oppiella nova]